MGVRRPGLLMMICASRIVTNFTKRRMMDSTKKAILGSMLLALFLAASTVSAPAVEVGEKAPDFELPSTQGGKFKLSELQGKKNLLIQFYVLDFTPT